MAEQRNDEKFVEMTQTPVEKLISRLAVPAIISMMITTIYNMVDTFFIGQISTSASGAVGIAFSVMAIIQALGFFFGQGSGASLSHALGNRDEQRAQELANVGLFSALICGVIFGALGLIFMKPMVYFLGATETIYPYCVAYLSLIFIGAPWMTASFVLNNLLRFQGNAYLGMIGLTIGGVLNMILDPIMIFGLDMGISGAALATILSQAISFTILLYQCNAHGAVKISPKFFRPSLIHYNAIFHSGLPSLLRQGVASAATICLNTAARPFGDAAIAAMAIVSKVMNFSNSAMLGFGQGFQPVCGYNYGAKLFDRVKRGFFFCVRVSAVILLCFAIVEFLFARQIIGIFRDDPAVITIGARALRLQCVTLIFNSVIISSNMLLQTSGRVVPASIVSISRQGLFLIPSVLLLSHFFGLTGLQMAQPVADVFTMALILPIDFKFLRELDDPFERLPGAKTKH